MRVLLVEDEKHDYRIVKHTLNKSDLACEIVWARRGEEAIEHLQAEPVDLILLDFKLPGISGLETFEQIITQCINVPVVFVTGSGNESIAVEALKLGAQDYLVKDPQGKYLKLLPIVAYKAYSQWKDSQARKRAEAERERLLAAEHEQRLLAETLHQITLALTAQINPQAVLDEILRQTQRLTPSQAANIMLLDAARNTVQVAAWRGYETRGGQELISHLLQSLADLPLVAEVVQSRQSLVIADTQQESGWVTFDQTTWIRSCIAVPICHRDRVLGLLWLDGDAPGEFSPADAERLQSLANAAAIALENARLYEQAQQDADTKALLLREMNHRVQNNLTAITGMLYIKQRRAPQTGDRRTYTAMIGDLVSWIKGLSTVHQLLSAANWSPLPLSDLARRVIDVALQSLLPDRRVAVDVVATAPVLVSPKVAHNLGMVINELTTNVIKYAAPPKKNSQISVRISPAPDEETILFEFRDNGPGFPAAVLRSASRHVGMYLIKNTVRHTLRGEITLHNDNGAVATIQFAKEME